MLSDRTKVVRGVMVFLAGCALLGLFMGLRGAMPGNVDPEFGSDAPVSTTSGVVVEAAPVADNALVATNTETNDVATNEVEEEEDAETPAPAPTPQPAAPVTPAPKEEAPPADPVGDLIDPATPAPAPPIGDLY